MDVFNFYIDFDEQPDPHKRGRKPSIFSDKKPPKKWTPEAGFSPTEKRVLQAVWNLRAFDSDSAAPFNAIFEEFKSCGFTVINGTVSLARTRLVRRGVLEFVFADKKAPKVGKEFKKGERLYFKDKDEFLEELKNVIDLGEDDEQKNA